MHIKLDNFSYGYKENFTLGAISIEIKEGEKIAIMGKNGSGKTTLLNSIAGFFKPNSGHLFVDSKDIFNVKNGTKEYWRKVSYLIQAPERQIFSSTLHDEIAYPLKARGFKKGEIDKAVDEALFKVGLRSVSKNENPFILSGGQRRKLAMASALAYRPEVVLLDEPLAGLDGFSKKEVLSLLDDLDGATVVMVTHDVLSALKMDRLIVLDEGKIIYDGNSSILLDKNKYSEFGMKVSDVANIVSFLSDIGQNSLKTLVEEILYD